MIYLNFIRSKKFIIPLLIFFIGIPLQLVIIYRVEKKAILKEIDSELLEAATNIKYYLGKDYVSKKLNGRSYNKERAVEIFTDLQERAVEQNVDYLYILVKSEDDIVYAALSDYKEELDDSEKAYFWYSLTEAEDDSFDETWSAFDREEPLFLNSSDEWDSYRSVYLTETAPDGTKYIAGADVTITTLNDKIMERIMRIMKMFLIAFPIIISFAHMERENKIIEGEMEKLSTKDTLTGVYNRKHGLKMFKELSEKGMEAEVFIVDIRGLNKINADQGLTTGDRMIKAFAGILKKSVRKSDIVMRLEGDKFMVVLSEFPVESEENMLVNLQGSLNNFNMNNPTNLYIQIIHLFKSYKKGEVEGFIGGMLKDLIAKKRYVSEKDIEMVQEMFESIEEDRFVVHYQPKVNIQTESISYEALIRWDHPEKGLIYPDYFIHVAERSVLINKLTIFVLNESLKAAGRMNTKISVNISPAAFESDLFISEVKEILGKSKYNNLLTFEITEGVAIDDVQNTLEKIKILTEYGVVFSIDDFGTGYSSLGYLEKLPVREVKIDKTFTDNLKLKTINPMIVRFICELGKVMEFDVVIEGVEREEQIWELMKLGGSSFQGYFFDRGHPIDVTIKNRKMCLEKVKIFNDPAGS